MGLGNSDTDVQSSLGFEDGDVKRSKALAADREQLPAGYYRSSRLVGTFFGIGMSLVATYFAFQAGAAAVASINQDIGPSDNSSLFSIVWTISQPISILLFGRLSDRFGRRNFVIGANILGIIGGIVACTAKTMNTLVGAQVLLGLASGPPASYPLMTGELMSNKSKFLGTICVVIPNVIATGFGPYIGQRLVFVANWRWIFYIYLMMIGMVSLSFFDLLIFVGPMLNISSVPGTVSYWFFYYPPSFLQLHGAKTRKRDEAMTIDFVGVFLLVAGLALFLLGVSWGGQPSPWSSPKILGLLISGAVCCVSFVLYECFANIEKPIIPMRFFRDVRGFACLMVISSVMGVVNVALFIMYPQQVTYIFGSTSTGWEQTAWLSSTAAFGAWAGIIFVGAFFHIVKRIRWQLIVGSIWMTAFLGAMASINRTNQAAAIVFSFFSMLAIGWGEVLTMLLVQYVTADQDLGVAFGMYYISYSFNPELELTRHSSQRSSRRHERSGAQFSLELSSPFTPTNCLNSFSLRSFLLCNKLGFPKRHSRTS